jgi:hypothetical protein
MVYATHRLLLRCSALTLAALLPLNAGPAHAQEPRRGASPLNLPRPGYEPRLIHVGASTIALETQLGARYDSNVYAAHINERDDIILTAVPQARIDSDFDKIQLQTDFYAAIREHTQETRESSVAFGAGTSLDYSINRANALSADIRFDRQIESRADPEARAGVIDPPRKINSGEAQLEYRWRRNRLGLEATGAIQRSNYLAASEADRDMTGYRGSLRAAFRVGGSMDMFVEGYATRRDFDRADFTGVDRDSTTIGALAGVRQELSGRWRGSVGVGLFRFDPKDPSLSGFSGFAANGNITWTPQPRTAVTAQDFRGDVATVRSGASGRTDTRISLSINQEVRHNLLLSAGVAYRDTSYRGLSTRNQKLMTGEVEAEYLVNRFASVYASASHARRTSRFDPDEFDRTTVGVGVRLRY